MHDVKLISLAILVCSVILSLVLRSGVLSSLSSSIAFKMFADSPRAFLLLLLATVVSLNNAFFYGDLKTVAEKEKFPFAFGKDVCDELQAIELSNTPGNLLAAFSSQKDILKGVINGEKVFLKTPAKQSGLDESIKILDIFFTEPPFPETDEKSIEDISRSLRTEDKKVHLCPNGTDVRSLLKEILKTKLEFPKLVYAWTMMQFNPEAALLQILQPPKWPVPKFYGSCGKLFIVEDCGTMLTNFYSVDFERRARISANLIKMAFQFTSQHQRFAFYFTDLSPDNIAVDENDNVRLVDLDHSIVVDKYPKDTSIYPDWNEPYSILNENCESCYAFRPSEICTRKTTDMNILSVCREILFTTSIIFKDGLLYDAPPSVFMMLYDCVYPNLGTPRFQVARQLISELENFSKNQTSRLI